MGGRGSSSGISRSKYASKDKTIINGETLRIKRIVRTDAFVLQAISEGDGKIVLKRADADEYEQQNKKTTYAIHNLKAGITNQEGRHVYSGGGSYSHNINWDAVKTVSGDTYAAKALLYKQGLRWDKERKVWRKG